MQKNLLLAYKYTADITELESALKNLENHFKILKNLMNSLSNGFKTLDSLKTNTVFKNLTIESKQTGNAIKSLTMETNNLGNSFLKNTNKLELFSKKLSQMRGKSTAGWGLTMIMASMLPLMLSPLMNFEHSQALLQGYGGFKNQIKPYKDAQNNTLYINAAKALREEAMYIGANTVKTTTEATQGLLTLAKMGFNLGQIARLGMPVTQFAIAGDMDVETAAKIMTMAISQFHLKTDTESINLNLDRMIKAATMSQMDVKDMLQFLGRGGATAAAAGLDFNQFLAVASVIKDAVGGVSQTATGLRSSVIDLLAFTKRTGFAYKQLGITNVGAEIRRLGTFGFVKELRDRSSALHPDYYTNINFLNDLFGKQQAAAGAALLQNIDIIEARFNELKDHAKGSMQEVNDYLNKSLYGSWKLLQSRIENFIITLGNPTSMGGGGLTKILSQIMQGGASFFNYLANLPILLKQTLSYALLGIGTFITLGVVTKIWGFTLGLAESGIKLLIGTIKTFNLIIVGTQALVEAFTVTIKALKTAFYMLATGEFISELVLAAPFIAATGAILGVLAATMLLFNYLDTKATGHGILSDLFSGAKKDAHLFGGLINSILSGNWDYLTEAREKWLGQKSTVTLPDKTPMESDFDKSKKVIFKQITDLAKSTGLFNLTQPSKFSNLPKDLQVLSFLDYRLKGGDPNSFLKISTPLDKNTQANEENTKAIHELTGSVKNLSTKVNSTTSSTAHQPTSSSLPTTLGNEIANLVMPFLWSK